MTVKKEFFPQDYTPWASRIDRRAVLKHAGMGALLLAAAPLLTARKAYALPTSGAWTVSFKHAHTGETFNGAYRVGDKYLPDAFHKLNHVLRDFRTGDQITMDPHVLDIISTVQRRAGGRPLEIIGGYRCAATNAMLHETTSGVAKNSMHLYGRAIDLRMPGYSTAQVHKIAMGLKAGGVGYYPSSDFVHVDTGKVRYW